MQLFHQCCTVLGFIMELVSYVISSVKLLYLYVMFVLDLPEVEDSSLIAFGLCSCQKGFFKVRNVFTP